MHLSSVRGNIVILLLAASVAILLGTGWQFCRHSDDIAFLPEFTGAKWIIDPAPPEIVTRPAKPLEITFRKSVVAPAPPTEFTMTIRAFKSATVYINGKKVSDLDCDGKNWKSPVCAEITRFLRVGTNEVQVFVTNNLGPPALWVRMKSGNSCIGTDTAWQASIANGIWHKAQLAAQPVEIPQSSPLHDDISTFAALKVVWREYFLILAIGLGILFFAGRRQISSLSKKTKLSPAWLVLAIVIGVRAAMMINDLPLLPENAGFDSPSHLQYVQYVQEHGTLPPPDQGWEFHQPPLYYLSAAAVMKAFGLPANSPGSLIPLRLVTGVFGLLHCWLALLCLRRLFPGNLSAQTVGLLVAAFLPPNLYLSVYVTNDPLAGLLTTTALYFLLSALQSETEAVGNYAALGLALGAAMLTKLSALPAVVTCLFILSWRHLLTPQPSARAWLRSAGLVTFLCFSVCGWYYLRNWFHDGGYPIPNAANSNWWQFPGFRTASYYWGFGRVLTFPLYSGFYSFADGIYSTLWGDGTASSAVSMIFRPPWNYDFMKVGYLFSLPLTGLAIIGMILSGRRITDKPQWAWLLMTASISVYVLAVLSLTILGPWQSQVKATYAFPALIPLCSVIALGWNWLAERNKALKAGLWIIVLLWTFTSVRSFWINPDTAETWRSRAVSAYQHQHFSNTVEDASHSLQLAPDDFLSRWILASALHAEGDSKGAFEQYAKALQINPDAPEILELFAQTLIDGNPQKAPAAIKLAEKACRLTDFRRDDMLTTLARAYAEAGQTNQAISTAQSACDLASREGDTELFDRNNALIKHYQTNN